jgi:hypothetical protein
MVKLTHKQQAFVEYYLQNWNATLSAKKAGYRGNDNVLASIGSENLTKPAIQRYIQARLIELGKHTDASIQQRVKKIRRRRQRGVVYFLRADNGLIKIGKTTDLDLRLRQLNRVLPYDVEVLIVLVSDNIHILEEALHKKFEGYLVKGEWFRITDEHLENVLYEYRENVSEAYT